MRVTLLSPPFVPEYMRNARCDFVSLSATQWYPIWLGFAGALLEKHGHDVQFIDAPASYYDHDHTAKIINEFQPDIVAVYTGLKSLDNDISFAERLSDENETIIVYVGPYFSIYPKDFLAKSQNDGHLGIQGEFDYPLLELANSEKHTSIQNMLYKENYEIVTNVVRPYITTKELDEIPFVSKFFKKHVDFGAYKSISEYYPYIDIMTGRGCKWGFCTYCLWVFSYIKGQTYNVRSVENVLDELEYISNELPEIKSVMIQDDTFTEERAKEISEGILRRKIKVIWSCYSRGNMSIETMKLMKAAGCRNLHVGFESGNKEVLKRIKKGVTRERMTQFARDAKKAGLRLHADFAFGFPGETPEKAQETIDWACKMNPHTAQFQLMIPFPGTPYYDEMKKNGWLNENGEPNMPDFTNEQIRETAKKAYRSFYISFSYCLKCLRHPYEHLFGRLKTISRAIPAMFWKRW